MSLNHIADFNKKQKTFSLIQITPSNILYLAQVTKQEPIQSIQHNPIHQQNTIPQNYPKKQRLA